MEIITRAEAIERGLKRYFTGKPCKQGHLAERFVKGAICYGCSSLRARAWLAANPERKKTLDAEYRAANGDKAKAYRRQHYEANRDYYRLKAAEWDAANPGKRLASATAWSAANPDRRKAIRTKWSKGNKGACNFWTARRRALIRQRLPAWADLEQIAALYRAAQELSDLTGIPHDVDHYFPLQGELVSGLHVPENLRLVTSKANGSKGNKMPDGSWSHEADRARLMDSIRAPSAPLWATGYIVQMPGPS